MQPAVSRIAWAAMAACALIVTTAAVAQPAAGDSAALPRCSATVTDKCVEGGGGGGGAPKAHKHKAHHAKAKPAAAAPAKAPAKGK